MKLNYGLLFTYCEGCDCPSVLASTLSAINVTRCSRISAALLLLFLRFVFRHVKIETQSSHTHRTGGVSVSRSHRGRLKWDSGSCSPPLSPLLTYGGSGNCLTMTLLPSTSKCTVILFLVENSEDLGRWITENEIRNGSSDPVKSVSRAINGSQSRVCKNKKLCRDRVLHP
jgi:hypothetical protein